MSSLALTHSFMACSLISSFVPGCPMSSCSLSASLAWSHCRSISTFDGDEEVTDETFITALVNVLLSGIRVRFEDEQCALCTWNTFVVDFCLIRELIQHYNCCI